MGKNVSYGIFFGLIYRILTQKNFNRLSTSISSEQTVSSSTDGYENIIEKSKTHLRFRFTISMFTAFGCSSVIIVFEISEEVLVRVCVCLCGFSVSMGGRWTQYSTYNLMFWGLFNSSADEEWWAHCIGESCTFHRWFNKVLWMIPYSIVVWIYLPCLRRSQIFPFNHASGACSGSRYSLSAYPCSTHFGLRTTLHSHRKRIEN